MVGHSPAIRKIISKGKNIFSEAQRSTTKQEERSFEDINLRGHLRGSMAKTSSKCMRNRLPKNQHQYFTKHIGAKYCTPRKLFRIPQESTLQSNSMDEMNSEEESSSGNSTLGLNIEASLNKINSSTASTKKRFILRSSRGK